jgi:hypothetical protein
MVMGKKTLYILRSRIGVNGLSLLFNPDTQLNCLDTSIVSKAILERKGYANFNIEKIFGYHRYLISTDERHIFDVGEAYEGSFGYYSNQTVYRNAFYKTHFLERGKYMKKY